MKSTHWLCLIYFPLTPVSRASITWIKHDTCRPMKKIAYTICHRNICLFRGKKITATGETVLFRRFPCGANPEDLPHISPPDCTASESPPSSAPLGQGCRARSPTSQPCRGLCWFSFHCGRLCGSLPAIRVPVKGRDERNPWYCHDHGHRTDTSFPRVMVRSPLVWGFNSHWVRRPPVKTSTFRRP